MAKPPPGTSPQQQASVYGISKIKRHILLCAGPDCVDAMAGQEAWDFLKRRIAELGLQKEPHCVYRTRCACLRMCTGGPIAVVYPDGVWYHHATPEVLERILQEHILAGRVVGEFVLARNRMGD